MTRERLPCGCIVLLDADGLPCHVLHRCSGYPPDDGSVDEIPDWQAFRTGEHRRRERYRQRRNQLLRERRAKARAR